MSRIEVITGVERKRRWSDSEKFKILSEAYSARAKVTHVARQYDILPQQIHQWRRKLWPRALPTVDLPTFLPVSVIEAEPVPPGTKGPTQRGCSAERVEVRLKNGRVLKISGDMDRGALASLIVCVEQA